MNAARQNEQSIFHTFFKYVSSNVLGMIGFSCYILADVFFIARGIGADALAALNLTLPAYNLMNGIGLMIGMGGAARYSLSSTRPDSDTHRTAFTHALLLAALCALFFSFAEHFVQKRFPPYSAPITTRSVTPPTTSAYCFSSPRSFSETIFFFVL